MQQLHQQQHRLGSKEIAALVEAYQAGASQRELAKRYGIHRTTVTAHLERAGVAVRPTDKLTQDDIAKAAELYTQGWSLARIGDVLGVHPHSVRNRLLAMGVRMRDTHGREK